MGYSMDGQSTLVYITETGWESSKSLNRYLRQYYTYALENIWNDDRVLAVTPFCSRVTPGPFFWI